MKLTEFGIAGNRVWDGRINFNHMDGIEMFPLYSAILLCLPAISKFDM